jgi:predicted transposase YbfD/YdcC
MALLADKAEIEQTDTLVKVKAPYHSQMIDALKVIGAKWDAQNKVWYVPAEDEGKLREVVRPYFQIEGEESFVQWKTVKLHIKFEQNKRRGHRKCVLIDGHDLLNVNYGNLYKVGTVFDILESSGGFTEGDERSPYWTVEYDLTVKVRANAVIEEMSGTCKEIE